MKAPSSTYYRILRLPGTFVIVELTTGAKLIHSRLGLALRVFGVLGSVHFRVFGCFRVVA